ncbi:hypothetical protein CWM47_25385 [Spirosoma pollinicola]|uniref:Uncharacterized protein n=1 Tax=Spirosoma pollinicola TaxID=2057025 RepID=A0A2K8Z4S7_9BACT|nr:hypothetical protein CWM47_25385 [Spirosoma pollinicola]
MGWTGYVFVVYMGKEDVGLTPTGPTTPNPLLKQEGAMPKGIIFTFLFIDKTKRCLWVLV